MIRHLVVLASLVLFSSVAAFAGGDGHGSAALPSVPAHGAAAGHGAAQDQGTHHVMSSAWQLRLPKGDPARGREAFVKFECYACHRVSGESFPADAVGDKGPDLAVMGPMHPAEYFAESIVNPDAAMDPQYVGLDGRSPMPSFNEDLTVQELIDLVAYLKSLGGPTVARRH